MFDCLNQILSLMKSHGANRFYCKKLAPNDNSKNQIYLGGDFSSLNIIPHQSIQQDIEACAGSKTERFKASIKFYWIDADGCHNAPGAQLIMYPTYPEVRMSGLLKSCTKAPSDVMIVRDEGRILILGITPEGDILGFACTSDNPIAHEINSRKLPQFGVFHELTLSPLGLDSRSLLLTKLKEIYQKCWIPSQKIDANGKLKHYSALNGGGYTLEAELGISPNGFSEPDYLGWEIKQYGVRDFRSFKPKSAVTLMTPEPTGGIYHDDGIDVFIRRFGYPDTSGKINRLNFGGVYSCAKEFHSRTNLKLGLAGYDSAVGKIVDFSGGITLTSRQDDIAAFWGFESILGHWNRKHAQAAYIPSLFRTPPPEYSYGPQILLCEQTDFRLFLEAINSGVVYYDPGIKMENENAANPTTKRRSQFRVKHSDLSKLYKKYEYVKFL
ncbi:MAG: hypothetical protein RL095_4073 [Verrucomicrobiota bacterium]|jgi:hypothetical protein